MKKYELTNETIRYCGRTLYRIKALRDFANVKAGDLGGFVESEDNLSHEGDCWIYYGAMVYGFAKIYDNVKIINNAEVYTDTFGNIAFSSNTQIQGDIKIHFEPRK